MKVVNHLHRLIFFIVCSHHLSFCEGSEITVKEEVSYINEFQTALGKQIEKEFDLKLIEDGIHYSSLIGFYAYRRATLEEARALELSVLNRFAEEIHSDPKMLSSLNALFLTPESICVSIHFVYLHNRGYHDGSIDSVYSANNNDQRYLEYISTDPFSGYSAEVDETFRARFEETFEVAHLL